ncbi:hypothetical protein [Paraburkholderia tropica]|uniref:hypothetical protein n=1 Tax=Paraburkholderia tropica TaxID=92647 RepID=UPI002AB18E20|nr:hypothetical protein [Paraburkholderia tropica]
MKKNKLNSGITKLTVGASVCAALAACGGGGGGSGLPASNPNTGGNNPPATNNAQITGKVIDGYLNGATVCFDNGQGACDGTLPSTTTDASGSYSLPSDPSYLGKTLIAVVTPKTTDASRPVGFIFPASFTLSQTVSATGTENITPLTSLVTAQMQTGLSQGQATAGVSRMLGGVDPNADYVAAGDSTTSTTAQTIVNTLTSFATNGTVDAATNRNALNAMVAANSPTVTAAQVQAQASQPVFGSVNAAQVLSQPLFSLDGYDWDMSAVASGSFNTSALVQNIAQFSSDQLSITQQTYLSGAWQAPAAAQFETLQGVYEMKADGTWSSFVPVSSYRAPLRITTVGQALSGTDPNTGIGFTYTLRSIDLGNQALATAVPMNWSVIGNLWKMSPLTTTNFTKPTNAYESLLSYNADQIILPVWVPACEAGAIVNGEDCGGNGVQAVMEDGVISQITGDPTVTYTSIQQAVGLSQDLQFAGRAGGFGALINADGTISQVTGGSSGTTTTRIGTWSIYSRNPNVMILNIPTSAFAQMGSDPIENPVYNGAQLVLALRNGHMRMGWLYSAGYAQKTYQFAGSLNAQLLSGAQAAVTPQ